jgi:hypothetical protein
MMPISIRGAVAVLALGLGSPGSYAQQAEAEVISFRCALALDAVVAELDTQAENRVTQQALDRIDEDSGEFVCVRADEKTIVVRLQSPDMAPTEGKLIFTVDARTYRVLKTYFGP